MEKAFYRIGEVAELIGLGRSKTYQLVASGQIPSVFLGGSRSRRVPALALQRLIEKESQECDVVDSVRS